MGTDMNNTSGNDLDELEHSREERAFTLYCQGMRIAEIAVTLAVSETTIRRWLRARLETLAQEERAERAEQLLRAIEHPGSLGVIGAPTYPMLRDATARTFFALLPASLIASYNKTEGHLILRNGSEILFRSLDAPDGLRGLNLAWFWLDEAPLCGYYAWQVLKGRLRQRGYATSGWATGTPKGRDGFARDFELSR